METKAIGVLENFRKQLKFVSKMTMKRNIKSEYPFEVLMPENIPNSKL